MNTSTIGPTLAAHKVPLMLAGGGVAVALGLRARSKSAAGAAPVGATIAGYAPSSATGAAYDSTGNDVYNALQPQIEQTQGMLGQLQNLLSGTPLPTRPTPVPVAPKPTTTPTYPKVTDYLPVKPRTAPPPAPVRKSPAPTGRYTVRRGDNLTAIGKRYGLTWQQLYNANRATVGRNPNKIFAGQTLTIPR